MKLPIYVTARRPNLRVTYVCETREWAGQKLRDFRDAGDRPITARDASGRALSRREMAMLSMLAGPYNQVAGAAA